MPCSGQWSLPRPSLAIDGSVEVFFHLDRINLEHRCRLEPVQTRHDAPGDRQGPGVVGLDIAVDQTARRGDLILGLLDLLPQQAMVAVAVTCALSSA